MSWNIIETFMEFSKAFFKEVIIPLLVFFLILYGLMIGGALIMQWHIQEHGTILSRAFDAKVAECEYYSEHGTYEDWEDCANSAIILGEAMIKEVS